MALYASVLTLKLLCAMTYVGAAIAAFTTDSRALRQRAVHRVASPALLATWLLGGVLAALRGTSLLRPWIVSGFGLSLLSSFILVYCATRAPDSRAGQRACLGAIALTVALMVARPGGSVPGSTRAPRDVSASTLVLSSGGAP